LKASKDLLRNIRAFHGVGCNDCGGTGKSGRIGVYEVLPITPSIEAMILQKESDTELRRVAIEEGMYSLRMSAIEKMKIGMISIEEVFAVTTGS
ncbi:MAG: type II secretion system protein GspE, partial [Candidatus Zixiibacteriota bacterium]